MERKCPTHLGVIHVVSIKNLMRFNIFIFKEMTEPLKKASQTINHNRSMAQSLALSIIICLFLTSMTPLVHEHNIMLCYYFGFHIL